MDGAQGGVGGGVDRLAFPAKRLRPLRGRQHRPHRHLDLAARLVEVEAEAAKRVNAGLSEAAITDAVDEALEWARRR